MDISPLAGKPAPAALLVDVAKLVTAYYSERPDVSVPEQRVAFGTSGHRGCAFAGTFNEWHVLAISQAICDYRQQHDINGPLYLGIDTHALSVPALASAVEVLAANGVEVMLADEDEYTPTPVISHAILQYNRGRSEGLADGIVITPSHNPPADGGFKYNPPNGGPADKDITGWIEARANEFLKNGLKGVSRLTYAKARRAATTHRHDFVQAYVNDLDQIIDLEAIRSANIRMGVDPLGGAGVHYWGPIAERYGLDLTVVNEAVDPTFRFMTVDWDGRIRMDPSSTYAMQSLIGLKDRFDIAFACDTDHDRHGIVSGKAGLLPPNHYLAVAIFYLFQHRPLWRKEAAVGKTLVSSQMIDRVTARLGRKLYEVPVGFKWFVDGLLDGSLGFGGEESAGASFVRTDGSVWTTDKDGIVPALLAAEITARMGRDPGEIYLELTREFGTPVYDRVEAPATPEQKRALAQLSPEQVQSAALAGEKIDDILTRAPGNDAPIGGLKVVAKSGWFAARPSGTEDIYKIYAESFAGADHLSRILSEAQSIVDAALAAPVQAPQRPGTEMSQPTRASHPLYGMLPTDVEGFDALAELALDLRSCWNHATDRVWRQLDPVQWELTHNPWGVLQTVSRDQIERASDDPEFRKIVDDLVQARRDEAEAPSWFAQAHPQALSGGIAYFSMEYMLSEALPIYSGGLGNVAGDQLKAASDLGVPVIGVGLLYQQGYFRQVIDQNGAQQALFPYNDPGQLPIRPLRQDNGEWLRFKIDLPGYSVWLRTWQAQVGRARLYLLDSNDAANIPAHQGITSELYGGGPELRLKQELLLGIGGWRLLAALGIKPEVCHLNEGHAAFAVLERARGFMQESGQDFDVALAVTRAGNLFTTHTAVAAGFDRFPAALIEQYLGGYAEKALGITLHDLLALGRQNPADASEPFNMAYLAMRGSGAANAVSSLHGRVSRHLFASLFQHWPVAEVPIEHVTNGVHMPTWDSAPADDLWTGACGKDRWLGEIHHLEENIRRVSDADLWQFRMAGAESLVDYARERLSRQLVATPGAPPADVDQARQLFDCNTLTLGFARRFATYKRPNLLLHDPQRLLRLLTNPQRPVQLIIAGKAHPQDQAGQALIQQWIQFIRRPEARAHVIFLSDYDMLLTEHLVQGVDVWLNTPRRPWEACGTSGMKVLVNGGINLSELDGWWAEAYSPEVGWALGDGLEHDDDPAWDAAEAQALYDLLEQQVIPEFYTRDEQGIPGAWVARMRESMARLTPQFSSNRAVREYTEKYYLPAASAYRERAAGQGAIGMQIVKWHSELEHKWAAQRFGEVKVTTEGEHHEFAAQVYLDGLDPDTVRVEIYADGIEDGAPVRQEMKRVRPLAGSSGGYDYRATVPAARPATDYTARLMARPDHIVVPLEDVHILWQK